MMSRNRRRWEESATSSHWEPGYHRSYSDEYSRRHYAPPTSELLPRSTFNYWRDDVVSPPSHYPRRPYRRESYSERWRDESRSWHAESSYSTRRCDFGPSRDQDDRESRRDRSPPRRTPYAHRPSIRARSPIESVRTFPKHSPPEPPRKASPPPNMSSQSSEPSPGYLALSQEPSQILRDPAVARKLLVLDLNGTLLIRSPRVRTASGRHIRPVQPRPYVQSFRQYLFCLETKTWLDTMVWSSAQPHSVDDMVDKVFGTTRSELKAVWNRKSLGLSQADYNRKAVTTKDLTKTWDLFASALSPEKSQGGSVVSPQSQITHSALTTLLLDDSPHKAVLQPYSHACIPEYDSIKRAHDLRSFLATKDPKQSKKAKRKDLAETTSHSTDQAVPQPLHEGSPTEKEPYDITLLAVIGILETVKSQSNVASWIRKGGLWATQERREEGGGEPDDVHYSPGGIAGGKKVSTTVVRTGNDASSTSDPALTSEQACLQTKMWFDDSSVVAFWVAQGRRALVELGIQVVHGMTG